MESSDKIIITVSGADKVGIVAKVATLLANNQVNIEDIKQKASTQLKFMISSIIDDPKLSLDQKREFIQTLLQEYNLLVLLYI